MLVGTVGGNSDGRIFYAFAERFGGNNGRLGVWCRPAISPNECISSNEWFLPFNQEGIWWAFGVDEETQTALFAAHALSSNAASGQFFEAV